MSSPADLEDGCASSEEIRKFAYVWTTAVAIIALLLVQNLSAIDRQMFDSKGKFIDGRAHVENRLSATSLPSESVDARRLNHFPAPETHAAGQ